ncbi:zinc-dependent alcohol dehydrogenase [Actinoalloteichus hymeniacidonis]|uniref:Theronine dehydrogenase-like Zn-dependent dehydrogenase n=1 Tax=Actinoalloteichus hymeniacidonis TaxID=340345 RepID=A0AAC9HMF9_9PSEU|nr:alcohol dehydrogenase catalytic domain-containing protein [Actinoalloteichus hymeniacidonis]AOS62007.1 theronine dehydrogenase-like Zn-dependent dehydrogenase [Actinoalloteichus hymeniacidonis]MBB5909971.1 2-desacetyl-2-hydroxyethyl bacteriochlorophyllide A dehydrogenase [Actinoalloteichus hymeniacidonis]
MSDNEILALIVRGPKQHELERMPRPVVGEGEALVAVTHVAVCGTDLRLLRGTLHDAEYPVIPGHEWAGRVLEAPSRPELIGKAVVGEGITPCGRCTSCVAGRHNLCLDLDEVGFTRAGAFAEAFTVPEANLRLLPDHLTGAEGCLLEPLCVALHAVERAPDLAGRDVGIIGAGTIGLLIGQLAVAAGAGSVTVAEPSAHRRSIATEFGLGSCTAMGDWAENQPEVVFDATGVASVFPLGLEATRLGGSYVLVGYSGEESTTSAPSTVMLRELTVYGVLSGYDQIDEALRVVAEGTVRLRPLLSDSIPIENYRSVLDEQENPPLRSVFVTGVE